MTMHTRESCNPSLGKHGMFFYRSTNFQDFPTSFTCTATTCAIKRSTSELGNHRKRTSSPTPPPTASRSSKETNTETATSLTSSRAFVIEEDSIAGIDSVGFTVVDNYPIGVQFCYPWEDRTGEGEKGTGYREKLDTVEPF